MGGRGLSLFGHVLQDHVDVVIKSTQCAHQLLVSAHDDPYPRADAFVDEFCTWHSAGQFVRTPRQGLPRATHRAAGFAMPFSDEKKTTGQGTVGS